MHNGIKQTVVLYNGGGAKPPSISYYERWQYNMCTIFCKYRSVTNVHDCICNELLIKITYKTLNQKNKNVINYILFDSFTLSISIS